MSDDNNKNVFNEATKETDMLPDIEKRDENERSSNFEEEAAKYKDHWLRAVAEAENIRKRAAKERDDALKYGITKFAQDMLAIADNMNRALESCPESLPNEFHGVIEGVKLIRDEIKCIFDRHGIREINPVGDVFDPNLHQAMFEVPATESMKVGTVAQVLQIGYLIHDRLLRPALVGVAKGDVSSQKSEENKDSESVQLSSVDVKI